MPLKFFKRFYNSILEQVKNMASISNLTSLIKSLSKSEKRYFKWSYPAQSGDKIYTDLYNLIDSKGLSDQSIKDHLKKKYPDAVLEPAYKHLYKMLMRSLRNYESEKSVENKLSNILGDVKILFNKGIFDLCFSEIEKAKNLALKYEKFGFYLIFARQELQYLTNLEFPNIDENILLKKQEEINSYLNHEIFINRHSSLYELLSYRYYKTGSVRNELESRKLNDLLLEESQVNSKKKYDSFESAKLHLHFQSTYFLMTGSANESLKLFGELNELFQKNKSLWADAPAYYLYLLHGILTDLYLVNKPEEMPYYIDELHKIVTNSESLLLLKEHLVYFHWIGCYSLENNINKALNTAAAYEKAFINKKAAIAPNSSAAMSFRLAVIYFIKRDFQKSLQLVNTVLNLSASYISTQLYVLGRILHLIIQVELGNDEYLQYEIKSVERKLKKEKKLFTLEKITIQFLKKWVNTIDREKALKEFAKAISELEKNEYENQLLRQFPFSKWIKALLQKKPLLDIKEY